MQTRSGVRLLVVDDDDAIRRAYEAHFSAAGFQVDCASTLQEAAERLGSRPYDAVIADVCLSGDVEAEGMSIAAHLRQAAHTPRVVVLTAYGAPDKAVAAAQLGVDAFLHKPVSLLWLERLLRSRIDDERPGPETPAVLAVG